jgi:S-formylglutathione hydrolase FrmB
VPGLRISAAVSALLLYSTFGHAEQQNTPEHLFVHVQLSDGFSHPVSGRLLVFIEQGTGAKEVDLSAFAPTAVSVAAKEIAGMKSGDTVDVDLDDLVFPAAVSKLQPGDYQAQAVLDTAHSYNYLGRTAGDLISPVTDLKGWNPGLRSGFRLTLDKVVPEDSTPEPHMAPERLVAFKKSLQALDFTSDVLTRFWGRPIRMRGWILLPPSYSANSTNRYPTVYFTHGFGGNAPRLLRIAAMFYERMADKKMPEMIWVLLDQSSRTGTHEFADSVNNGPWGTALTTELIPHLERQYRMDGRARGRFLQGHSSGGWATLWLQVTYPRIFGGTWSTSPDPSDFHDFTGPDLYAPGANMYRKPDGTPWPIVRENGKVVATMEDFVKLEELLGDPGGQIASFEWVFSPRGPDGRPVKMFDRITGDIDPKTVAYWRSHYDISHLVEANWKNLSKDLTGKIHVYVGTADTFYLDGSAHKLQAVLDGLNADAHFTFIPERTHFDLYKIKDDSYALFDQIAAEMYQVARTANHRTSPRVEHGSPATQQ